MLKKIFKRSVLLASALLAIWSCKESFLSPPPTDRISDGSYWTSPAEFEAGLFAAYFTMQWDASSDSWQANANMPSGDMHPQEDTDFQNLEGLKFNATNRYFGAQWSSLWLLITRANLVVTRLEDAPIPQADKTRLMAEAKFLRGFGYFQLARSFGGVPLILAAQTAVSPTDVASTPVDQVFAQVAKDLTEAAAGLPAKWDNDNIGRANKGSALGYLAYTNMYLKQWPAAAKATEDLFAIGTYALVKDYRKLFDINNENNEESVFEVQYRYSQVGWGPSRNGHYFPMKQAPRGIGEKYAPYGGWGVQVPSKELVAAFEPGDDRRVKTILGPGETYYGYKMTKEATSTGYAFTKYWIGPSDNDHSGLNLPQLRFAEVLLNYAETLNELNRTAEAYPFINRVRERAKLAPLTVGSKQQAMDAIMQERRVETFAEFNFWFDLTRTGRAAAFVKKEYGRTMAPNMNVFALPQSELDLNKALKQNPGY